jgi:hypothetical protein
MTYGIPVRKSSLFPDCLFLLLRLTLDCSQGLTFAYRLRHHLRHRLVNRPNTRFRPLCLLRLCRVYN